MLAIVWSIEKLQAYLGNKKFRVITDHKPLEAFIEKNNFGTKRIQRWFEKIARFEFSIEYRPGKQLVQADALSRAILHVEEEKDDRETMKKRVMEIHYANDHRKDKALYMNLKVMESDLKLILDECIECIQTNPKMLYKGRYVNTNKPGELIAFDFLELKKGVYILLAIDYFTRMAFGRKTENRREKEIIGLIQEIKNVLKIEAVKFDNAKEFQGKQLKKALQQDGIKIQYSIPYYHESNGRIERLNRTIRNALAKKRKINNKVVKDTIETYNEQVHRAIKMSPKEAMEEKNWEMVMNNAQKYAKEFKEINLQQYEKNDKVIIKNFTIKNKNDKRYKEKGTIEEIIGNNTYRIRIDDSNKLIVRHGQHMKKLPNTCPKTKDKF